MPWVVSYAEPQNISSIAAAGVIVDKPFLEHSPGDLDINLNVNVSSQEYP